MATLLATLRPAGVAGDQDDGTYDAVNDGGAGGPVTMLHSWLPLSAWDGVGTIEFVRIFTRGSHYHYHEEQGPLDPLAGPAWRNGTGPAYQSAAQLQLLDSTVYEVSSGDLALAPNGAAWDATTVAALRVSMISTTNSDGTQLFTQMNRHEEWVEIWGSASALINPETLTLAVDGDLSATVSADGDLTLTLPCGDPGATLACEGGFGITVACDMDEEV